MSPKRYEAIRDACLQRGGQEKACKTSAAKIYNNTRKAGDAPVTGKREKGKSR